MSKPIEKLPININLFFINFITYTIFSQFEDETINGETMKKESSVLPPVLFVIHCEPEVPDFS